MIIGVLESAGSRKPCECCTKNAQRIAGLDTVGQKSRTDAFAAGDYLHDMHDADGEVHFAGMSAERGRDRIEAGLQRRKRGEQFLWREMRRSTDLQEVNYVGRIDQSAVVLGRQ